MGVPAFLAVNQKALCNCDGFKAKWAAERALPHYDESSWIKRVGRIYAKKSIQNHVKRAAADVVKCNSMGVDSVAARLCGFFFSVS